jgi:hypothetical protein
MKGVITIEWHAPDGTPVQRIQNYFEDAIAIGVEQLDEDPGTRLDGFIGEIKVKRTG